MANSRVGDITNAPTPSCRPHFFRHSDSIKGTTYASVFPLPVFAAPRTSRPHSACGSVARCIAVISLNLHSRSAAFVAWLIGRCANFRIPISDVPASPSELLRGATASGLSPLAGLVSAMTASISAISASTRALADRRFVVFARAFVFLSFAIARGAGADAGGTRRRVKRRRRRRSSSGNCWTRDATSDEPRWMRGRDARRKDERAAGAS